MNFQDLKKVETADFYFELAAKRTKARIEKLRHGSLRGSNLQRSKFLELSKLESVESTIASQFDSIIKSFPSFDNLAEFYRYLIDVFLDTVHMKKSIASLKWCIEKNRQFLREYKRKIKQATEISRINQYRREFYGRIGSTLKQIKSNLQYLETARKTMLDFPSIKTEPTTIAIAGFPNVGKTTLLAKLTGSKAKIAHYAFTTKGINVGFAEINSEKVQFLDTPGTLNRFEKQNAIEKVATLAIKYLAEAVIYVFDLTETYPIDVQVKLYEQMKKTRKPVIVYLSKTDIVDKKTADDFKIKYNAATNADELKEKLEKIKFL